MPYLRARRRPAVLHRRGRRATSPAARPRLHGGLPRTGAGRSRTSSPTTGSSRWTSAGHGASSAPADGYTTDRFAADLAALLDHLGDRPGRRVRPLDGRQHRQRRSPWSTPSASRRSSRSTPPTCVDDEVAERHRPRCSTARRRRDRRALRAGDRRRRHGRPRAATSGCGPGRCAGSRPVEPHVLRHALLAQVSGMAPALG